MLTISLTLHLIYIFAHCVSCVPNMINSGTSDMHATLTDCDPSWCHVVFLMTEQLKFGDLKH